jgi:TP901-1 family phage major tail protein
MAWSVNTDLVKGNDMFLYIVLPDSSGDIPTGATSAQTIAYSSSCSLQIDADTIDVTSKLSCRWNELVQGNASYTISADALYCLKSAAAANDTYTVDDLFEAMVEGKNVGWYMAQDTSVTCGTVAGPDLTKPYYHGEAAITSLSITAGNNEICSSSITLTGSGKILQS